MAHSNSSWGSESPQKIDRSSDNVLRYALRAHPPIPREQEWELARRWHEHGDVKAMQALALHNLRFGLKCAFSFSWTGLEQKDLVQLAFMGLMEAAKRFDANKRVKFTTYSTWWIRQSILRSALSYNQTIRTPNYWRKLQREVRRVSRELTQTLGHRPSPKELAEASGVKLSIIKDMYVTPDDRKNVRLSDAVSDDDDRTHQDIIADPNAVDPSELILKRKMSELVYEMLALLAERERKILRLRFGIGTDHPLTLEQIGERLKLSRERVRQIEREGMHKIRRELIRRKEEANEARYQRKEKKNAAQNEQQSEPRSPQPKPQQANAYTNSNKPALSSIDEIMYQWWSDRP